MFGKSSWPTVSKKLRKLLRPLLGPTVATCLVVASIWGVGELDERYAFLDWRYVVHQYLQRGAAWLRGHPLGDQQTIVVLIGDEEFWKGSYAGRTPINEKSLGDLIKALNGLKPKVIAVDFNFSSPTADGSIIQNEAYKEETRAFANAVKEVTAERPVVLTKALVWVGPSQDPEWAALPNRFDDYKSEVERAKFGYINLPYDFRFIPLSLVLADTSRLDSFSEAIVRSAALKPDEALAIDQDGSENYCGAYLGQDKIVTYYANDILKADEATRKQLETPFSKAIVIVGAGWSKDAAADPANKDNKPEVVDSFYTPAGTLPAAFMHANFVESILASRTGVPLPEKFRWLLEFALGAFAYLLFRGWLPWLATGRYLTIAELSYFPALFLVWAVISYIGFHNLGLFVDPFAPSLAGAVEPVCERIIDWRKAANLCSKEHKNWGPKNQVNVSN